MGCSRFLRFLLVAALLALSSSHGLHRKLMVSSIKDGDFSSTTARAEESSGMSREIIEVMDYSDPGPNTNPKTGYIFSPPPRG